MNVQLVNTRNDSHLWAEKYDRKLTDVFGVESEIAKAIADTLQAKLSGSEQRAINAIERGAGPETKIHIDAIPDDGGRVRWGGDEPKDPGAVRRLHPGAIVPHCQPATEERGAVQSKVEADAVVFDNERTNPKRADDAAGLDDDPERTICNGDGALTEDV